MGPLPVRRAGRCFARGRSCSSRGMNVGNEKSHWLWNGLHRLRRRVAVAACPSGGTAPQLSFWDSRPRLAVGIPLGSAARAAMMVWAISQGEQEVEGGW